MSSFSIPPLTGGINFDISQFTGAMATVAQQAGAVPGQIAAGIDQPLQQAEAEMGRVGAGAGGLAEAMGHAMASSGAALQLFPPLVIEWIENPILAAIATVKQLGQAVAEIVAEVGRNFQAVNLGSITTGLDPTTFSSFSAAAEAAGVSVATFANGLELLMERATLASQGDEASAKGFERLGISSSQLTSLLADPREMLLTVADAMAAIPTRGERTAAAMESMGRGGKAMLSFLLEGRAGIESMAASIDKLDHVDGASARLGAVFQDASTKISKAWQGVEDKLAEPVLAYLQDHGQQILGGVASAAKGMGDAFGAVMQYLVPWGETLWGVVQSIGSLLSDVLTPALETLWGVLRPIADLVKAILDGVAIGLNGFSGAIHQAVGDSAGAQTSLTRADAAWGRLQEDFGGSRDGTAAAGTGPAIKVDVNIDPDATASQIAGKLRPHIARGYEELAARAQAAAAGDRVRGAMGGRR